MLKMKEIVLVTFINELDDHRHFTYTQHIIVLVNPVSLYLLLPASANGCSKTTLFSTPFIAAVFTVKLNFAHRIDAWWTLQRLQGYHFQPLFVYVFPCVCVLKMGFCACKSRGDAQKKVALNLQSLSFFFFT